MDNKPIRNFNDFVDVLLAVGFSMGGGNSEGIISIIPWSWNEHPPYETPVRWHTGDPENDPWEWRMRVLDERDDIAYAKMFFNKSGYITKEWAPFFIAVRRENRSFESAYEDGIVSNCAKRIYNVVRDHGTLPLHDIKQFGGFGKSEKAQFERALIELQMKMFLTMCGRQQKISQRGEEYGWSSTVFCTTESFWGEEIFSKASDLDQVQALAEIKERIFILNPNVEQKRMMRFIKG